MEALNFFRTPGRETGLDHVGKDFSRAVATREKASTGEHEAENTFSPSVPDSLSSQSSLSSPDSVQASLSWEKDGPEFVRLRGDLKKKQDALDTEEDPVKWSALNKEIKLLREQVEAMESELTSSVRKRTVN